MGGSCRNDDTGVYPENRTHLAPLRFASRTSLASSWRLSVSEGTMGVMAIPAGIPASESMLSVLSRCSGAGACPSMFAAMRGSRVKTLNVTRKDPVAANCFKRSRSLSMVVDFVCMET